MAKKSRKKAKQKNKHRSVNPVPSGFRTVTAYLVVDDGARAIEFYKKAFGAKELSRNNTPDGKVLNAQIKIGDSIVMLSDEFPGSAAKSPLSLGSSTVTLHVYSKNADKLWEQVLSCGARITMPLENQFWGERYGMLVDPLGHHWSISQRIKMSPKEMEERRRAAMAMFAEGGQETTAKVPEGGESPAGVL